MQVEIRQIQYESDDYRAAVSLRYQVLREPLGLQFTPEELENEISEFHLGAFLDDGGIVGSLSLRALSRAEVKMRQVAIASGIQGKGVGRKLVVASEDFARARGFKRMILNAREVAVPFYTALGYAVEGQPFVEVGLPHRKMFKELI